MSDTVSPARESSYLDSLPAIYRDGKGGGAPGFLGRFLLGFEHVLTGVVKDDGRRLDEPRAPEEALGLEQLLDRVHEHFDPARTPNDFLDWLAGWVALTLRGDLDSLATTLEGEGEEGEGAAAENRRSMARNLIANVVPLYRLRGTRRGLEALISLYTGGLSPTITEMTASFQIGVMSRIGEDTLLDGGAPHYFHVLLRLPKPSPGARRRFEEIARSIIELEKPAHTRYRLDVVTPTMQIGVHSQVGVDTLLSPSGQSAGTQT